MLIPFSIAVADSWFSFLPYFGDAAQFDSLAWEQAQVVRSGSVPESLLHGSKSVNGYTGTLAVLYAILGHQELAGVALNCGFWGVTVIYWSEMAAMASTKRAGTLLAPLFIMFPAGNLYAAVLLRESIALFFLTYTLWRLWHWLRTGLHSHLYLAAFAAVPVAVLRAELLPPIAVSLVLALIYKFQLTPKKTISVVGLSGLLGMALFYIDREVSTHLNPINIKLLEEIRNNHITGPHPYLVGWEYGTWIDVIVSLPVRFGYLLFSPFPWNAANYELFIVTIDVIFLLGIVAVMGVSTWQSWHLSRPENLFLIGYAVSLLAGYSLVVTTKGAASRRRLYAVPVILFAASYGISLYSQYIKVIGVAPHQKN